MRSIAYMGQLLGFFARKRHVASQRAMFAMFANLAAKMKGQGLGALRDKKLR